MRRKSEVLDPDQALLLRESADHPPQPPCNARTLLDLLAKRHKDDIFVPECKDGPTHGAQHARLDAWAMNRSWADARFWGYEIKVSRGDFLRDGKMHRYLPLCSDFYLVCPAGLIGAHEIPAEAGLLWATKNGAQLYQKKRAPHRAIEPPAALLLYVLMNRVRITGELDLSDKPADRREFWERWLEEKTLSRNLGHRVSHSLGAALRGELEQARERARVAEQRAKELADVEGLLVSLGINVGGAIWQAKNRVARALGQSPDELLRTLQHARQAIETAEQALRQPKVVVNAAGEPGDEQEAAGA